MENSIKSNDSVVVENLINAPIAKVWQALTDIRQIHQWYFNVSDFKLVVGFEFEFTATGSEGEPYVHICIVKEIIPNEKLAYSWRYEGYTGNSLVAFELFEERDNTQVKIIHTGLETFPAEEAFTKSNFNIGWTHILNNQLKDFVEK